MEPKFNKDYCKSVETNGYVFCFYETRDNTYAFQKGNYREGFKLMRLFEQDMNRKNVEFMMNNDLSREIPANYLK